MCNWYTAPSDTDTSSDTPTTRTHPTGIYCLYVLSRHLTAVPEDGMQNNTDTYDKRGRHKNIFIFKL